MKKAPLSCSEAFFILAGREDALFRVFSDETVEFKLDIVIFIIRGDGCCDYPAL